MKLRLTLYAVLAVSAALLAGNAFAQDKPAKDKKEKAQAGAPDMEEMMKKWEAAATPGPAHKALEALVGEWEVDSKCSMGPDAPPMESKGTSKTRWILGGRFLQDDFAGDFMGKPMKGLGFTGYDNMKKKYTSVWLDEGGTGIFTSEGAADSAGKVFTFHGKMDDPMTGEKDKKMKYILRIVSADKHTFEMHDLSKGDKSLCAEMTYTRK